MEATNLTDILKKINESDELSNQEINLSLSAIDYNKKNIYN